MVCLKYLVRISFLLSLFIYIQCGIGNNSIKYDSYFENYNKDSTEVLTFDTIPLNSINMFRDYFNDIEIKYKLGINELEIIETYSKMRILTSDTVNDGSLNSNSNTFKVGLSDLIDFHSIENSGSDFYVYLVIKESLVPKYSNEGLRGWDEPDINYSYCKSKDVVTVLLNVLMNSKTKGHNTLIKLLSKAGFVLDKNLKNMHISILFANTYNFTFTWDNMLVAENLWQNTKYGTNGLPIDCGKILRSKTMESQAIYRSIEFDYRVCEDQEFSSKLIRLTNQFLRETYKDLDSQNGPQFKGDSRLVLKKVKGLISGRNNIWENIEIFIFTSCDDAKAKLEIILDGDWHAGSHRGSGPTTEALRKPGSGKLDYDYREELESYGDRLLQELKIYINERK